MISAKKMKEYFDKKYSDENTAKMIVNDIKHRIKYGSINPSFAGRWYKGLSDGTIKILMKKGYIIRRSAEHCDVVGVLFRDTNVGLPYESDISLGE